MRNKITMAVLLLMIIITCCKKDDSVIPTYQQKKQMISICIPTEKGNKTKSTIQSPDDSKDIIVKWHTNDKLQLCFSQDDINKIVNDVAISNISADGKKAKFVLEMPIEIDPSKAYTLYAVTGAKIEIHQNKPIALINTRMVELNKKGIAQLKLPMYFKQTVTNGKPFNATFKHIGAMVVFSITNNTGEDRDDEKLPKITRKGNTNTYPYYWGNNHYFDLNTNNIISSDGIATVNDNVMVSDFKNNSTIKAVQWFVPKTIKGKTVCAVNYGDINSINSVMIRQLKVGRAYHLGVILEKDDNKLQVIAKGSEATTPQQISFTTTKGAVNLYIDAEEADKSNVWIDLNNNGIKEKDEAFTKFKKDITLNKTAETITIYGRVTTFGCVQNEISKLDVTKNAALQTLGCGENNLTQLDISKNTALTMLVAPENKLTNLDVSKNVQLSTLSIYKNKLERLDVTKNNNLKVFACQENNLNELDVTQNTALKEFFCENNNLTSLDLSQNTQLEWFDCENNQLSSLDVKNNTKLDDFNCKGNPLTCIEVNSTQLAAIPDDWKKDDAARYSDDCSKMPVTSISLNKTAVTLEKDGKEQLTATITPEDATNKNVTWTTSNANIATVSNTGLVTAVAAGSATITATTEDGGITATCEVTVKTDERMTLTTTKNEISLYFRAEEADKASIWIDLNNNGIKDTGEAVTKFDENTSYTKTEETVTIYGKVTKFRCYANDLSNLDVSKNTALTKLYCADNNLSDLDVSKNTVLTNLGCTDNNISDLDISANTALKELYCTNNKLSDLDISANTTLIKLYCDNNELTQLNVKQNTSLTNFDCRNNPSLTCIEVNNTQLKSIPSGWEKDDAARYSEDCSKMPVTGISLNKTAITLDKDGKEQLTATITPEDATNKNVTWTTSDENIATVSNTGLVTAVAAGSATITATTEDGGIKATCEVTVKSDERMTLTTTKNEIKLNCYVEEADKSAVWIDLNNNGIKDTGEAVTKFSETVTYTKTAKTITIYGKVTVFFCESNDLSSLDVSKNTALTALQCSSNNLSDLDVSQNTKLEQLYCERTQLVSLSVKNNTLLERLFCQSNPSLTCIEVNSTQLNSTPSMWYKDDTATYKEDCSKVAVTSVSLNKTAITLDKTGEEQLTATITPEDATNKNVTWTTSDENIATVSNTGLVTAVAAGSATITVTTEDGGIKATCEVTVKSDERMTLTTTKNEIILKFNAEEADKANIWIDLNNNGTKDTGEAVTEFDETVTYTKTEETITIYGKATLFICESNDLSSLDVGKNTALTMLECSRNNLSDLDVSQNTKLEQLYCERTQLVSLSVKNNTLLERLFCQDNPSLTCIEVNNTQLNSTPSMWYKDDTATYKEDCSKVAVTSVSLNKTAITLDKTGEEQLTATIAPEDATNKNVTWTTSDENIATVSNTGLVTAVAAGSATITATTEDGGIKATCEVTVKTDERMTLNTGAEDISLYLNAAEADKANIWIDLNNNGTKDTGEAVTEFDENTNYTKTAETITIYGKATKLGCGSNGLRSLDVSKNTALTYLSFGHNQINSLDISKNTALEELHCNNNRFNSLDVSKNTALKALNCHGNKLSSLDVSKNTVLISLDCYNNELTSLDISKNTALKYLYCYDNNLSQLNVKQNTLLEELECQDNPSLTCIEVNSTQLNTPPSGWRKDDTATYKEDCSKVAVTSVSLNKSNTTLYKDGKEQLTATITPDDATNKNVTWTTSDENIATVSNTGLVTAVAVGSATITATTEDGGIKATCEVTVKSDVKTTLTTTVNEIYINLDAEEADKAAVWIDLNNNGVKDTGEAVTKFNQNVAYTKTIETITVYGKVTFISFVPADKISSLNVSQNTALKELHCNNQKLSELDISKNTALTKLHCSENNISDLDVSQNTALTLLGCSNNNLSDLDISANSALEYLYCSDNKLSQLNVKQNTSLKVLNCKNNSSLTCIEVNNTQLGSIPSYWYKDDTANYKEDCSAVAVTNVSLNKSNTTLYKDGKEQLTATIAPEDATNKNVTWTTSDENIATVSNTGLVTAVGDGSATITATTEDGGIKATCVVTVYVYPASEKIEVKGGTFQMGSNDEYEDAEHPIHGVTVSDFYIGKYEITNAQYAEFLNAKGNQTEDGATWLDINNGDCQIEKNGEKFQAKSGKENYPVVTVTWHGAKAYAKWVGGRLPTEAEWEYAARGGKKSNGYKYSGSNNVNEVAWHAENSGYHLHPIGTKLANELGIYDMSGNVFEWCEDKWHDNYNGAPTDGSAWTGSNSGRVMRSGGWRSYEDASRVANRSYNYPHRSSNDAGFRVVFEPK